MLLLDQTNQSDVWHMTRIEMARDAITDDNEQGAKKGRDKAGISFREVVKKSKWKFRMAFAMKGGGSRPVSSATYLF